MEKIFKAQKRLQAYADNVIFWTPGRIRAFNLAASKLREKQLSFLLAKN